MESDRCRYAARTWCLGTLLSSLLLDTSAGSMELQANGLISHCC